MLKAKQQRAIGLLAMGYDVFQVARLCGCNRATVYRWQQQEEFAAARDRHIREMMTAMHSQIQATARDYIEGNLDAVRELRHLVLDPHTPPAVRRSACNDLARHSGRWYDLMGFNAKLESSKKLAVDEPDAANAEEVPDEEPNGCATDAPCNDSSVQGALHPQLAPHSFASATRPPNPLPVDGEGEVGIAAREVAPRSAAPQSPPRPPSPPSPQEAAADAHRMRQDALHAEPLEDEEDEGSPAAAGRGDNGVYGARASCPRATKGDRRSTRAAAGTESCPPPGAQPAAAAST